MGKERIIIADYRTSSHWPSCDLIKSEVLASYVSPEIWFQGEGVSCPQGDTLVIADHRWLDHDSLNSLTKENRKLKIYLHVYGDLTIKLPLFYKFWDALKAFDLSLVVLSHPQKKLLETLCPEAIGKIIVRSIEVDPKIFSFSKSARETFRNEYSLQGKVFGYAGRICRQKGVLELMEAFLKAHIPDSKLLLVGPLAPHPFWQFDPQINDDGFTPQFTKLLTLGKDSILWLKNLPYQEMPAFYSGIDEFVSPSYFHDEDFGMTVSEALAVGTPTLISKWGGYLGRADHPKVRFINMKLAPRGITINTDSLTQKLQGTKDQTTQPTLNAKATLSEEQIQSLKEKSAFLKNDRGEFDLELYQVLYQNYL